MVEPGPRASEVFPSSAYIFARLHHRDHKLKYLTDAPRFFSYLDEVLPKYPALSGLAGFIEQRIKPLFEAPALT